MDETVDQYQELMQRHEAMAKQWMTFVDAALNKGWTAEMLHSAGITLGKSGTLQMLGRDQRGALVLQLRMAPGDAEVQFDYVAPWIEELVS
jgi:hypothetical protein